MEKRSLIKRLLAWVLCITMAIQSFGIMPSVSAEEAKEEEAYEVLTFSDFGIDDGTYTEQQNGSAELESMDHAAFIGKVTFLSDDQHIRLMSIKDEEDKALADISVQENQLKVTDLVTEEATDLGEIELGQEYELQITFDCEDENVVMCYYLDGEEKGTHTSENTAENMEPKIVIDPKEDGVVVASYEEETQEQETEAAQEAEPISEPEVLSVEGESETSDYTELTFSDFGLEDKEYTSTGAYNELFKTTKVTSLDHVAISGKVQFTAQKGELRIGTSSADNQKSVATVGCWTKNLNGKDFINAPGTEYELSAKWNDEVEVRITFDYVNGNDVKVVYYINGTSVGEYTSSGVADKLQPAIRILSTGGSNPIGVKLTSTKNGSGTTEPDPSETAVYKTLTFSDWDITEGIYQTGKTYSLKDTAITSLHGYAFEGIVNFNGANNGNNNIKIAGTSQDPHHAVQICSENGLQIHNWRSDGGTDEVATYQPENWDNTKEMTLRVTFYEKSEDQWILHVFINDNEVGKLELKDTKFGTSLYFNGTQIQVRDANTSAADESKYKQYTFKHFGLYDGVYEEPKKATADITGMDGITFSGKITFLEDKQQIRLISTDEGGEVSIASVEVYNKVLQVTDWTSDNQTKLGTIEIGKEIDVKITFHYVDNDVVIRYYIDGELKASQVAKDVTDKIQPILLIKASGKGIQIASDPTADPDYQLPALTPEPEEYKTLTFSDWDIVYGIYQPGKAYALKDTTIKSLHGYAFEGIVNFNGCDNGDNNIKIGGADNPNVALQLWSEKGLKLHNHFNSANGTFVWNKLDNKKEMTIRLEFYERLTDNWIIYLYVNGEKIGKMELTDTKLGTSLYFNGTKIKVRDTGTKEEDDSSYKKITFKHFGLPDGTYQGVKLGTANLKSMDQVAVVGKVKFLMDKQEIRLLSTNDTGYLSIASVGIWNKELQVTDWTSNNQTKLGTIKVGQEVDLRITFKYVGQDVVIKYYIDGELRAAHVAKNVVSKLQMTLLVIPKGKGLDLISDPVVGAGINLPELPGKVIITEEDFKQSTPEELGYKEITLSSFGLEDDVSYGKLKKAEHTTASYVRPSLNNTYGEATLAKICMDYGKAATKGVKRAGQGAQVVCAALTGTERGKSFLRACYRYIEVQQDKDPGSYFSILNWHPYVFYTYGTGGPVGTTEDWEGWQEEWVNFQKDYYQIAVDAGDRGRPVWFTEFGVTDCGRYNTKEAGWPTMGPVTEKMAADRLMQMLDLTERELPYVETSFIFRITDLGDQFFPEKSELANFVYNYEANFGLVESFDDCRSANAVLKESGKALYRRMNPEAADLTKIYQMLERHYQQYQNRMKKAKEQEFDGVVNGFELCDPEIMKKK